MNKIADVINKFDPLQLFPYAPSNEYEKEIERIALFLQDYESCNVDLLAHEIYNTFTESFGRDIFNRSVDDCYNVAFILLKNIKEI